MIARLSGPLVLATTLACAAPVAAQTGAGHSGHGAAEHDAPRETASTRAFREAAERMHAVMDAPLTGDVEVDFARGMIAHHQGAIDMVRILLEHGGDPTCAGLRRKSSRRRSRRSRFSGSGWPGLASSPGQ